MAGVKFYIGGGGGNKHKFVSYNILERLNRVLIRVSFIMVMGSVSTHFTFRVYFTNASIFTGFG